jgi:hypothetical protein
LTSSGSADDAAALVAKEYQKLIESGVLQPAGIFDDVHTAFHVYRHNDVLVVFHSNGALASMWTKLTHKDAWQRIMNKINAIP